MVLGHLGGSWAVGGILGRQGLDIRMVASAHFWEEPAPGLIGRVHRHLREAYGERALGADRLISNTAPPEELVELVEAGATVGIAFDVPGSAATPFLGRSVSLTSGPASLAFRTRAKVLPVITERHGTRLDLRMLPPLDPADFRDIGALRAAIARTYEPLVIRRPEMVEVAWDPSPLVTETLAPHEPYVPGAPRVGV
jgi:lauroyl/myristoyl acyltransferase